MIREWIYKGAAAAVTLLFIAAVAAVAFHSSHL